MLILIMGKAWNHKPKPRCLQRGCSFGDWDLASGLRKQSLFKRIDQCPDSVLNRLKIKYKLLNHIDNRKSLDSLLTQVVVIIYLINCLLL